MGGYDSTLILASCRTEHLETSAEYTIDKLRQRGIPPLFWPPYSPNLNPIKAMWNKMKDYIELHHADLPAGK
jgi:transposase